MARVVITLFCLFIFVGCGIQNSDLDNLQQNETQHPVFSNELPQINDISLNTDDMQNDENNIEVPIDSNELIRDPFEPYLENLSELFMMTKTDVLEWLGDDYEIVPTGAEGLCKGYFYAEYGITIAFGYEFYLPNVHYILDERDIMYSDKVMFIVCEESIDILGAKVGMTFAEILTYLPNSEIRHYPPSAIEPYSPIFYLYFSYRESHVIFGAGPWDDAETIELRIDDNKSVDLHLARIFE
jgi:hypothetical protein